MRKCIDVYQTNAKFDPRLCWSTYVSLPKQKSQQKTDVCFRTLPAPTGKILAVATGVTAGPANLGIS